MRRRKDKSKQNHYVLLVNQTAGEYDRQLVKKLIEQIRKKGGYYTIFEPKSAVQLYHTAQRACGLRKWTRPAPQNFSRRGKVTALVACGGDGTVNLVGKVAQKANLPLGIIPMGKLNNIARSLCGEADPDEAIKKVVGKNYRKVDTASIGGKMFIGSAGIGFAPEMTELLSGRRPPRFCFGWSQLGAKAAAAVKPRKMGIVIDAFRFEVSPIILNFNLLRYSFGLPVNPISVPDDRAAEVILNFDMDTSPFSTYARHICAGKYVYGSGVRLFRGHQINFESAAGLTLYYDGETTTLKNNFAEVKIADSQLKVFC